MAVTAMSGNTEPPAVVTAVVAAKLAAAPAVRLEAAIAATRLAARTKLARAVRVVRTVGGQSDEDDGSAAMAQAAVAVAAAAAARARARVRAVARVREAPRAAAAVVRVGDDGDEGGEGVAAGRLALEEVVLAIAPQLCATAARPAMAARPAAKVAGMVSRILLLRESDEARIRAELCL